MTLLPVRLGLQQRVLPEYRAPFFDLLAASCLQGMSVFAGDPCAIESIDCQTHLRIARFTHADNLHLLRGPLYVCWQRGFLQWLEDWQPDVLIAEANPRYLNTPFAINWMHRRRRPVIGWGLGGSDHPGLRSIIRTPFINRFDALIAYSQTGKERYEQLGFPAGRIFVAPNAVAPRSTQPPPVRPPEFPQNKAAILFVGRLQARKRIDLLLAACAALPQEQQPNLIIIGDGPARNELQLLAAEVYPSAQFPGAVRGTDLDPYFARADLFVLPGTGGLAVQQAMSYALPVIVAEADGTQNDLVRPENGWRVQPGQLVHLISALQEALKEPARLRRMGDASFRIVSEEINLESMAAGFVAAIQSVL